jgi:hypothetical protein
MENIYLEGADLISVISDLKTEEDVKFLVGRVVNDLTHQYEPGEFIISKELKLCGKDVFLTIHGEIFKTSSCPRESEVSCAELLLMKLNNFELNQILDIRQYSNKGKLISAFDKVDEDEDEHTLMHNW